MWGANNSVSQVKFILLVGKIKGVGKVVIPKRCHPCLDCQGMFKNFKFLCPILVLQNNNFRNNATNFSLGSCTNEKPRLKNHCMRCPQDSHLALIFYNIRSVFPKVGSSWEWVLWSELRSWMKDGEQDFSLEDQHCLLILLWLSDIFD